MCLIGFRVEAKGERRPGRVKKKRRVNQCPLGVENCHKDLP